MNWSDVPLFACLKLCVCCCRSWSSSGEGSPSAVLLSTWSSGSGVSSWESESCSGGRWATLQRDESNSTHRLEAVSLRLPRASLWGQRCVQSHSGILGWHGRKGSLVRWGGRKLRLHSALIKNDSTTSKKTNYIMNVSIMKKVWLTSNEGPAFLLDQWGKHIFKQVII